MKKENIVIIAAGGSGKRLGLKGGKQYLPILGKPALFYTLCAFQKNKNTHRIIVVTNKKNFQLLKRIAKNYKITKLKKIVPAGRERFDSVKNGLKFIPRNAQLVLIHDGSRLILSQKLINRVIKAGEKFLAVVPAIMPADTIKEVENNNVKKTLSRKNLRLIQTPQAFSPQLIKNAYSNLKPDKNFTDDAIFLEKSGIPVKIVKGERSNIKLTYPEDKDFIEFFIKKHENWFRL